MVLGYSFCFQGTSVIGHREGAEAQASPETLDMSLLQSGMTLWYAGAGSALVPGSQELPAEVWECYKLGTPLEALSQQHGNWEPPKQAFIFAFS